MQFGILTLNLWGTYGPDPEKRWDFAAAECRALAPDIIVLQETSDPALLAAFGKRTELAVRLSDPKESGLAILSRWPARETGLRAYQTQSVPGELIRKAAWVDFEISGTLVRIVTTHLSWRSEDTLIRQRQAAEAASLSEGFNGPSILAGDFNAPVESGELELILRSGYQDAAQNFPAAQVPTWDNRNPHIQTHRTHFPDRRIDLIFFKSSSLNLRAKSCRRVLDSPNPVTGLFPSDHYGVLAHFNVAAVKPK